MSSIRDGSILPGAVLSAFCLFLRLLRPLYRLNRKSTIDILDAHFVHPDGVATALAAMVLRKSFVVTAGAANSLTASTACGDSGWAGRSGVRPE